MIYLQVVDANDVAEDAVFVRCMFMVTRTLYAQKALTITYTHRVLLVSLCVNSNEY